MNLSPCFPLGSVLACAALLPATGFAGTHFVDAGSTNSADDGTSWARAYRGPNGVRKALEFAAVGDEIWVAKGTYLPTRTGDRTRSFTLVDGIALYGGFAGGEVERDDRDPAAHETILSGDLGGDDATGHYADNSQCVVRMGSAVLDGFTITRGRAYGAGNAANGAGIQVVGPSVMSVVRRCVIRDNRSAGSGSGMWFDGLTATFEDCRFEGNAAGGDGGAVFIRGATDATFEDCRFEGNFAGGRGGGVLVSNPYDARFLRCIFTGNEASQGGAIQLFHNNTTLAVVRGCLIAGNSSSQGALDADGPASTIGIFDSTITANAGGGIRLGLAVQGLLEGSIVHSTGPSTLSNLLVRYSCTDVLQPGQGNIAADPQFVDAPGGNFRLLPTSPCIDASVQAYYRGGYDLERTARRQDLPNVPDTAPGTAPVPDMGAYETAAGLYTLACGTDTAIVRQCPCGNEGDEGTGCASTRAIGAYLEASGAVNPDTVRMLATGMPLNTTCVLLQGNAISGTGFLLGDGVLCVAGALKRMSAHSTTSGTAAFPGPNDLTISARSAALGDPIAPGTRRYYQVWFRDPDPSFCSLPTGGTSNLTSGITVYW